MTISLSTAQMDATGLADRIAVMQRQEDNAYRCSDYLKRLPVLEDQNPLAMKAVDEDCRIKMAQWSIQMADSCNFNRETVGIGMSYLDRYISTAHGSKALLDRKEFQLVAMCSFYIATKLFEPTQLDLGSLSMLSKGTYSAERIAQMEQDILSCLQWRMHPPTALSFVHHFINMLPPSAISASTREALLDFCRCRTELAISDYFFVTRKPSMIAAAAILSVIEEMDFTSFSVAARREFNEIMLQVGIDLRSKEVQIIRSRLRNILSQIYRDNLHLGIHNMPASPTGKQEIRKRSRSPSSPVSVCQKT